MIMKIIHKFNAEVQKNIELANAKFDLEMDVEIRNDLRGRSAGQAILKNGVLILRFNNEAIRNNYDEMVNETIPHEVAHLVCFLKPWLGRNHNHGWKNVCRILGGDASRTHEMDLKRSRAVTRFVYILADGTEAKLTKGQHEKIQFGSARLSMRAKATVSKTEQMIKRDNFIKVIKEK